jgi:hypothetical protein
LFGGFLLVTIIDKTNHSATTTTTNTLTMVRPQQKAAAARPPQMGHTQNMGLADSTVNVKNAAKNFGEYFRKLNDLPPLDDAIYEEFADENLKAYFLAFCKWASSTAIPAYADENMQPSNRENKRLCQRNTIEKYIIQIKEWIKSKFPHHPDFQSPESNFNPSWWTELLEQFRVKCDRFHQTIKGQGDTVFGETNYQPLFRTNQFEEIPGISERGPFFRDPENSLEPWFPSFDETKLTDHDDLISQIDLTYMLKNLCRNASTLRVNDKLQHRCWLLLLHLAVGRGGEIKYINFKEWTWHGWAQALDIGWTEVKVLQKYPMPMVMDAHGWLFNVFHALGSFWMVEDGLYRTPRQMAAGHHNYLFPMLHATATGKVTDKVTDVIRGTLPSNSPPEVVRAFSAKSERSGAVTQLSLTPFCGIFEVAARSGHKTGLAIDYYTDKSTIRNSLPGAKALSGYSRPDIIISVPQLEWLGNANKEAAIKFTQALFKTNIVDFQIGKRLFCVVKICAATLILYHCRVTYDLSPANAISTKMRDIARAVNLRSADNPDLEPEAVLDSWAETLHHKWQEVNETNNNCEADLGSISSTLNGLVASNATLQNEIRDNKRKTEERDHQFMSKLQKLHEEFSKSQAFYQQQCNELRVQLNVTSQKLAIIKTPPSSKTSQNVSASVNNEGNSGGGARATLSVNNMTAGGTVEVRQAVAGNIAEQVAHISQNENANATDESTPPTDATKRLIFGNEAKTLSEKGGGKGVNIATVLQTMHEGGYFSNTPTLSIKDCPVPPQFYEAAKLKYCLELIDWVITEDERFVLRRRPVMEENSNGMTLKDLYHNIQERCMDQMYVFEGKDPELEKKITKGGQRVRPYYVGLGARVYQYKKKIKEANGLTIDAGTINLINPEELNRPGTPKGNTSILSHFAPRNKQQKQK